MQRFESLDPESEGFLSVMAEQDKVQSRRIPGVRTVLIVLSAAGIVFDMDSLRQKVLLAYPDATVFFLTTCGKPVGPQAPQQVDILIDLTGPGQRQKLLFAKQMRRGARVAVGRNVGLFRKRIYDRVFDETARAVVTRLPKDILGRERFVQREVLALVGVALVQAGDTPPDRGKSIALELPPMSRL